MNISPKEFGAIILAAGIASFGGGFANLTVNDPRPDAFTGGDGDNLKKEISEDIIALKEAIYADMELRFIRLRLDIQMEVPPEAIRQRTMALEEAMKKVNPDFHPPTTQWR